MSRFTRALNIRKIEGTKYWLLQSEVVYHVDTYPSEEIVTAPAGFKTDGGSIPPQAWSIIGHPLDDGAQAFVIHDWLWQHPDDGMPTWAELHPDPTTTSTQDNDPVPRKRRRCDQILLQGLRILMPGWTRWWKRSTIYCLVRAFGGGVWKKYREKDEARRIAELCKERHHNQEG